MEIVIYWGMRVISALLILAAGWFLGNWTKNSMCKLSHLDGTLCSFLGGFAKYAIFIMSGIIVLGQFGVQTASLIAVLGAAGLAIGLALQGTLSNVAAGVMMLFLRPFNVGDYIDAAGIGGTVKTLGLFGVELATPDNVYIYVPNSKIWSSEISNYSRNPIRRQDFVVSISYNDDMDEAMKAVKQVLDAEPRLLRNEEGKEPQVMVSNMGDFSVDLIARVWTQSSDYWPVKWDMTKALKAKLDKVGITIPFPTRTLEIIRDDSNEEKEKEKKKPASKKAA